MGGLDGPRGLSFYFDGFLAYGVVNNRDFVPVLIAAAINDLLHFGGGVRGERKSADGELVVYAADSDLGVVGDHHGALEFLIAGLGFRLFDDDGLVNGN